jgi:N-acetylglucosamine-6-sulfatase
MRRRTAALLASMALAMVLASGVALLCLDVKEVSAQAQSKPNIVFVLTDDQFPGTENEMPNLRSNVTNQGVKFTSMVSTFPLCCPARATIQRGQYAHNTEIYGNSPRAGGWEKFQRRNLHKETVATWLNRAGYQTGLFGKYMNNYRDKVIPPGWDRWYGWNGVDMGWTSVNNQGHVKPLDRQEADSLVADRALGFLSTRLDGAAPVFAFVNFGAMHRPFAYAKVDADKFEGEGVPRNNPAFNEDDVRDKPDYVADLPPLSKKKISKLDQNYRNGLRSLMRVDRFIGNASDMLRRKGEMDNTYFVFYTDNGAHFGHHRFGHGKLQPYGEDTNFPLIIRGPGIDPAANPRLVGTHDIAPTLAEIGGATIPHSVPVDGRSFLELAQDQNTAWPRTAILSERENNGVPPNSWDMLRMENKIYTRHENELWAVNREYYDLKQDRFQLHNALGRSDTTYAPPNDATLTYYEERLDALYHCAGPSCRAAEDEPLLP